ncbi:hypothetical protein GCM10023091_28840 [Ravibacter arvi]|uniref:Uncharacterized protein n=1 Tax=Ravibacter arvi TaxID=2051041 RepID=A0ABP8M350_9BACT
MDGFKSNYPNCTVIPGILRISGTDITNLSGLAQITGVTRELVINGTSITNLNGLNNITSSGGALQILGNGSLTSLTGLGQINDLWLRLENNSALSSLRGMEHFTSINTLSISENLSLTDLTALSNLTTVTGVLDISVGTPVTSLAGLENLTQTEELWLQNLPSLADISALANLTTIDKWLYISNCPSLPDLDGLSNVEQIGDLIVFRNPALVSLDGLSSLKKITSSVTITNNDALSECAIKAICDFVSVEEALVSIDNNLGDCRDLNAVRAACVELPVRLVSFDASEEAGQAHLHWKTTDETNSHYFEIQKSQDAKNWHIIGSVLAKGSSRQPNQYAFTDRFLASSISYYRLRSVDLDGSYSLSPIVSVNMAGHRQPLVYPVPAVSGAWIEGGLNTKAELLNIRGNVLKTWQVTSDKDYLDLGDLNPGHYLIRIGGQAPLRLIKK